MNKKAFNDYSCRSNIYDIEYAAVYDLPFWTRLAAGVNTILEVPCGSGVRALHLASLGKDVTAVDIEPNMVALLQQKLANSSSFLKVTPKLADMRRLELASWFDAVFVIREGFQFLVDDGEAIETMRCLARHLRTDGFIAIDLADFAVSAKGSSYRLEYYDKNQPDHLWIDEWRRPVDDAGGFCMRRRRQRHEENQMVVIDFQYLLQQGAAKPKEWDASVRYRCYDHDGFLCIIERSGLHCTSVFGNYDFKPYVTGDPRMIFIIKRAA